MTISALPSNFTRLLWCALSLSFVTAIAGCQAPAEQPAPPSGALAQAPSVTQSPTGRPHASEAADPASSLPPAAAEFAASSRGTTYYPIVCDEWRRLAPANRIYFETEAAAQAAGYTRTRSAACAAIEGADGSAVIAAGECTVDRIIDGDTLVCRGGDRIRLLLIDSPEMAQSDYGLRARLALEELLPPGATARLELDVQPRDRYGRVLAYLWTAGGEFVNERMVRRGYAVVSVYPPNVRHVERLRAAADSARAERAGLWERDAFDCAPSDYRAGVCGR